jgi:hypothetical protein
MGGFRIGAISRCGHARRMIGVDSPHGLQMSESQVRVSKVAVSESEDLLINTVTKEFDCF